MTAIGSNEPIEANLEICNKLPNELKPNQRYLVADYGDDDTNGYYVTNSDNELFKLGLNKVEN